MLSSSARSRRQSAKSGTAAVFNPARSIIGYVMADTAHDTIKERAVQSFYLSANKPRDRRIVERLIDLHQVALNEDERIAPASLAQFTRFFLENPELALPKITLTPDGTLRARWINGRENFVAIEFTGQPLVKLVAEVPREGGLTAHHFANEPLESIIPIARAIGGSFAQ
jgi:hypothetical protein